MRRGSCPREMEIAGAIKRDKSLHEHRAHARECRDCGESLRVALWLEEALPEVEKSVVLPASETLWWRSQVVKKLCDREAHVDKQTRPLWLAQMAAVVVGVVTVVALLLGSEPMGGFVGALSEVVGGSAATVTVGVVISLLTGGIIAWHATQELR